MKKINIIISTKSFFVVVAVYILFFLFISSGKELLHNHKPDIYDHGGCPVFVLNHVLSTGILSQVDFQNEFIVESCFELPKLHFNYHSDHKIVSLRGPPTI